MVPKMAILVEAPVDAHIQRLAAGVHEAREEMDKVQLELNLQTVELLLKAQTSTPLEVREQCANAITSRLGEINNAVRDYTRMLEESFEVLTNIQEDLNIQRLETKVRELHQ